MEDKIIFEIDELMRHLDTIEELQELVDYVENEIVKRELEEDK